MTDEELGLREADCGCCYIVDKVALDELRAAHEPPTTCACGNPEMTAWRGRPFVHRAELPCYVTGATPGGES